MPGEQTIALVKDALDARTRREHLSFLGRIERLAGRVVGLLLRHRALVALGLFLCVWLGGALGLYIIGQIHEGADSLAGPDGRQPYTGAC
ncbi:MAG: hypothetical protein IT463_08185 [Planctomycetes bacterium]|nr:hypothetical protein [Planctomycetota bacterium]